MSLSTCVKIGTGVGLVGGFVSSAYFTGAAERANRNDNPATFVIEMLSVASFISGPIVGAGVGLGYYGLNRSIKRLQAAPQPIQVAAFTIMGSGIAIIGAYKLGKKDN